jgi:hypothetical protein
MTSATIKLFLPRGDAKSLRTAEIFNWTGKAVAAPRTEPEDLLAREELDKAGIYILIGSDPHTNAPRVYIGEAEVIRDRLKQHKTREFRVSAIVFASKDENLTKARVRHLESRSLEEAIKVNRFTFGSCSPSSGPIFSRRLPSQRRELSPVEFSSVVSRAQKREVNVQRMASWCLRAERPFQNNVPSAESYPYVLSERNQLLAEGKLIEKNGFLEFTKDAGFSSPSAAAAVIHGGSANGLIAWKTQDGKTLKELDEQV